MAIQHYLKHPKERELFSRAERFFQTTDLEPVVETIQGDWYNDEPDAETVVRYVPTGSIAAIDDERLAEMERFEQELADLRDINEDNVLRHMGVC